MNARNLAGWLIVGLGLSFAGCGSPVNRPYEACGYGEACSGGTQCLQTSLPASAGFSGALCTNVCNQPADCLQDLQNYETICVNSQCYIQCPTGGYNCPYGTGCLQFSDQFGYPVNLCTP
ncbi:MAG TPA: hypothetical protein PLW65_09810 [Pseudomonadota bacterium]|nr:hypothetical protein [Pseudomonadota bacterium]